MCRGSSWGTDISYDALICRSPEECPADVEAIIARCLDNDPDERPSARELVEFMVHLPQQLSLDSASTGTEGSNDRASSELPHLSQLSRQGLLDASSCCMSSCGNMCES